MKYSVVIAELNEPDLDNTMRNIRETQKNFGEIVVIPDINKKGPMRCRHEGIKQSAFDIVIIVDAHMRFEKGALDTLAEKTAENEVNCAKCYHNGDISLSGHCYSGANFVDKGCENNHYTGITCSWSSGKANSVMGACYCFHKKFYEKMGEPWQIGKGWGCDEEIISILAWLLGGSVNVVDVKVAHQYRTQTTLPYKLTTGQILGVWYNRIAMYHILPLTEWEREEYTEWIYRNSSCQMSRRDINRLLEKEHNVLSEINLKIVQNMKMSWDEFKQKIINQEVEEMKMPEIRHKCTLQGIVLPFGVTRDKALEILKTGKCPDKPKIENKKKLPVVEDFGIQCPHCGRRSKPTVTNTYPNGMRRVICCHCEKPFVTKAVF